VATYRKRKLQNEVKAYRTVETYYFHHLHSTVFYHNTSTRTLACGLGTFESGNETGIVCNSLPHAGWRSPWLSRLSPRKEKKKRKETRKQRNTREEVDKGKGGISITHFEFRHSLTL